MQLSEAIRLGAMSTRQGIGGWMDKDTRCALAGACDAAGIAPENGQGRLGIDYEALRATFPLLWMYVQSPFTSGRASVELVITVANDNWRWTREQIADWVETIEQQQEPEALQALSLVGVGIE